MPGRTLAELAQLVGGKVEGDPSAVITGLSSVEDAGAGDIVLAHEKKYLKLLASSKACAAIVKESAREGAALKNLIVCKNPQLAFSVILGLFRPAYRPAPGVHALAQVSPACRLGKDVSVQAFAVIEDGADIGDESVIFPGAYIGNGVKLGAQCLIYPGACVREGCVIGQRVIIHANAVIGSDGYGYAREGAKHAKIPQAGIVRLGDDVEVGACATIDRATLGETVIGRGTKIDNLVHIAHNVRIGEDAIIVAQVGIAGSATLGNRVQLGGQAGINGHIEIGDDAMIAAQAGVIGSLPGRAAYSGMPAIAHMDWLRAQSIFTKLPEMKKKIDELERKLDELGKKD